MLDRVELYLRTKTFPAGTPISTKRVTRATSKHYVYRGTMKTLTCWIYVFFCSTLLLFLLNFFRSHSVLQMACCGALTEAASSRWSGATMKSGSCWPVTMTTTTTLVAAEPWGRSWCVWRALFQYKSGSWGDVRDQTCPSACSWCTTGSEWRRRWRTGSKPVLTARAEFLLNHRSLLSASAWPTAAMRPATFTPTSASTGDHRPDGFH